VNTARSHSPNKPAPSRTYLLIGVTGGIGSGKSLLCAEFAKLGRKVFSADQIARELAESDLGVRDLIRESFGEGVFGGDGALDRKALARIVFAEKRARERLNAIIHPRVFEQLQRLLSSADPDELYPYAIVEAALIYESGMEKQLDYVVLVDAPVEERLKRTMDRDGSTREEVLRRMASQMSIHRKQQLADFLIENVGDVESLRDRLSFLDSLFARLARQRGTYREG
jgi:dephospho-CoA kinase